MKPLFDSLNEVGLEPLMLDRRVLVLPLGGRVIGLAPDQRTNVLWANPGLESPESLRARHATDRIIYCQAADGAASLVVRVFSLADEASYFDVPSDDPSAYTYTGCSPSSESTCPGKRPAFRHAASSL